VQRTYDIHPVWVIICSECGENIVERSDEGSIRSRADASEYKRQHENMHRLEEGRPTLRP
jgi:hypothetical protein